MESDQLQRQKVEINYNGIKFTVFLTAYEIAKVENDETFKNELIEKYYQLYINNLISGSTTTSDTQPSAADIVTTENDNLQIENSIENVIWIPHRKATEQDIQATRLLLQIRGTDEMKKKFCDKRHNKHMLWDRIAKEIIEAGYKFSGENPAEKCRQKFANLQKIYVSFMDNVKRTGAEYQPKPQFFDELHDIFCDKDKVIPRFLIDSLQPNTSTSNQSEMTNKTISNNERQIDSDKENQSDKPGASTSANHSNLHSNSKSFIKPQKNLVLETLKEMHKSQLNELKNVTKVITENMERQTSLLEVQTKQRGELIDIFKAIHSGKRKKRRRSSSSSS